MTKKQAIIACSGGLDSVTLSYYVKKNLDYSSTTLVFFNYGQKSLKAERKNSQMCAKNIGAKFVEIPLNWLENFSPSLINLAGKARNMRNKNLNNTKTESDRFYVPMRNTAFISALLAVAEYYFIREKIKSDIFLGFKNEGRESYKDTTIAYVKEMNKLSRVACAFPFKILAPFIKKDKEDIILLGKKLGVNFSKTHSCYISNKACGYCLACALRKSGFYWAGELE
jgi:7-cyano-7-deazaguanine synthase